MQCVQQTLPLERSDWVATVVAEPSGGAPATYQVRATFDADRVTRKVERIAFEDAPEGAPVRIALEQRAILVVLVVATKEGIPATFRLESLREPPPPPGTS